MWVVEGVFFKSKVMTSTMLLSHKLSRFPMAWVLLSYFDLTSNYALLWLIVSAMMQVICLLMMDWRSVKY